MIVGVISDTHGLLRPEALNALKDSSLIIHAGDVGKLEVLDALNEIAPVIAVRGNIDRGTWAEELPLTRAINIGCSNIFVLHDLGKLDFHPEATDFQVVISGHSHKPKEESKNGVIYLNPGSAGPRRFNLPVCVALLEFKKEGITNRFIKLN